MTNDAKLGMLVGVLGVIVAAVLLTNPAPPVQSQPTAKAPAQPSPRRRSRPSRRRGEARERTAGVNAGRARRGKRWRGNRRRARAADEEP